jgi:protein phosphatase 1 regulatory subunit 11
MVSLAQQQAPQPTAGSQTQTEQPSRKREPGQPQAILRLRGAHNPSDRSVTWSDDVVDNEGLGRKKSKGEWATFSIRFAACVPSAEPRPATGILG